MATQCLHLLEHSEALEHFVVLFLFMLIVGVQTATGLSILSPVKCVNDLLICKQNKAVSISDTEASIAMLAKQLK